MKVVYVDILLLINFIVNLLLLKCAGFFLSENFSGKRLFAASFAGALSSLFIFFPPMPFILTVLYKFLTGAVMIFICRGFLSAFQFAKAYFALLCCLFIFSGLLSFLYVTFKPSKMIMANGSFYLDITAPFLIISSGVSYIIVSSLNMFLKRKDIEEKECLLTIKKCGRSFCCKGLIDTGNSLTEPFSGLPVIVCRKGLFKYDEEEEREAMKSFRIIPYKCIEGEGCLKSFLADEIIIKFKDGREKKLKNGCYIALIGDSLSDDKAIINPALTENF